jgi:virginiamycin B lyase
MPVLAVAAVATAACGGSGAERTTAPERAEPTVTKLRLPRGSWPSKIAFDARGHMWITESSADAVAERRPDGQVLHHRLGEATETSVEDIVAGADGEIYFQGFQVVGWITPSGQVSGYELGGDMPIGLPSAMAKGPDDAVWFTSESIPPDVKRLKPDKSLRVYPLPAGDAGLELPAIAPGPGNTVWFIQKSSDAGLPPEALGRLDPEGGYTRIPLRHKRAGATRLVAGPDGAMWVTQQARYSIARVTSEGEVAEFRLKPGTVPFDIVSGRDGALWFTIDHGIGRVSTDGDIQTWAIPGAKDLKGIAQAPDGSFWVTDPPADVAYHFVPADA